ncbi:MAG: activator of (R)-2-hydroxyglutaryl-CoA dehydratase [Phycisphaerae bacterium]
MMDEARLNVGSIQHFRRPSEKGFTKDERSRVTVWFGGLTMRHERLILAGLQGLGYQVGIVPTPNKTDFQAGREYGNNGQCNPTYFTVGSLVNHLKQMRDEEGLSTEEIIRNHVFITAGACGPCRFGMYEAEYRLALRNSGFDGFRVLLFQQGGGLDQAAVEAGLEFNLNFFLTLINAIFMGDVLNEVANQIRPYETVSGRTDEALEKCLKLCQAALRRKNYDEIHGGRLARILSRFAPVRDGDDVGKFIDQLRGTYYTDILDRCRCLIEDEIEVDFTQPRPIVKITGEFWAQTTEGDGNFRMFRFLEGEGAEVLVEPVATWICYMLHQAEKAATDRRGLTGDGAGLRLKARLTGRLADRKKAFTLRLADRLVVREYNRLREATGGTTHELANQLELTRLGHPFYNSRASGGEGHLEIAKNIYYSNKGLAHMVLSLKPFGCMPSTQSDGAQAAVISQYKDMIYIPIETSGEGDINAHSRVQMALGEAKARCKDEFKAAVARTGFSIEQIRAYIAEHRELRRPLQPVAHHEGVVGKAASFVLDVASAMKAAHNEHAPRSGRRARPRRLAALVQADNG